MRIKSPKDIFLLWRNTYSKIKQVFSYLKWLTVSLMLLIIINIYLSQMSDKKTSTWFKVKSWLNLWFHLFGFWISFKCIRIVNNWQLTIDIDGRRCCCFLLLFGLLREMVKDFAFKSSTHLTDTQSLTT